MCIYIYLKIWQGGFWTNAGTRHGKPNLKPGTFTSVSQKKVNDREREVKHPLMHVRHISLHVL